MNYERSNETVKTASDFQNTSFKGDIFMNCGFNFGNGNNCCWIIIILLVLWFCCGSNHSNNNNCDCNCNSIC